MRETCLHKRIFGLKQRLLRLQDGDKIDRALTQPLLGEVEGAALAGDHLALNALALCIPPDGVERVLDVGKTGNHGLAVNLQQFILSALLQVEIPEQTTTFEDGLRQAGCGRINGRLRSQQELEEGALIAAFAG